MGVQLESPVGAPRSADQVGKQGLQKVQVHTKVSTCHETAEAARSAQLTEGSYSETKRRELIRTKFSVPVDSTARATFVFRFGALCATGFRPQKLEPATVFLGWWHPVDPPVRAASEASQRSRSQPRGTPLSLSSPRLHARLR